MAITDGVGIGIDPIEVGIGRVGALPAQGVQHTTHSPIGSIRRACDDEPITVWIRIIVHDVCGDWGVFIGLIDVINGHGDAGLAGMGASGAIPVANIAGALVAVVAAASVRRFEIVIRTGGTGSRAVFWYIAFAINAAALRSGVSGRMIANPCETLIEATRITVIGAASSVVFVVGLARSLSVTTIGIIAVRISGLTARRIQRLVAIVGAASISVAFVLIDAFTFGITAVGSCGFVIGDAG